MDECLTQFHLVFLIGCIGPVLADDKPISDSSIAALSIVFGFIFLVISLSLLCYCVRKTKQLNRNRRKEKLQEIRKVFEEHYSEYTPSTDDMVVISSNEKPQKYSEWRTTQPTTNLNSTPLIVTTQQTPRDSRYMVRTSRTARSISPTRTSPRTPLYERGRSRQRFVYPSQPSYNTLAYKRSKSAPNLNRKEYVPNFPNRQLVYTKSHYLAIKQPFSKKYLLPPVRTFYAERPSVKRVVVPPPPQRQVIVAPPKREVYKPNVYHVQYKPSPNQIVHRGKFHENIDEDFRLQTTNYRSYEEPIQTNYRSYEEPVQTTYTRSYEEPVQTTYRTYDEPIQTTLTNYQPRVVRPEPYVYKISNSEGGELKTTTWSGDNTGVNTQLLIAPEGESAFQRTTTYTMKYTDEARVSNGTDQNKTVADDYTIVDFVEADGQGRKSNNGVINFDGEGTSGTGMVTVISTSTSESQAVHNSSALNALDNLLGNKSSKSSSSSSSSSSKSS